MISRISFRRFLRFSLVGLSGVAVNQASLYLLTEYVLTARLYLAAAVLSTELALLNNFTWNELWAFRDKEYKGSLVGRLLRFHGSRILGILIGLAVLYLLTDMVGIYYLISNLISIALSTLVNYITSDLWVWR
jgi:dolichol-phosphate mannosyltransferase